ncbi:tail needle knob protein [Yersinia sp. 2544 StPb PI]|uniref:tail needle knob protein n=1 Tax=Yersinia sp. 2544 StPb PI TaxID=3117409 RepID=UPI003B28C01D
MADSSLNIPVTVAATRIDATLLPPIFSMPYQLYVIQNGMDFGNVAGKANDAGQGAYDAQVRNDEQDVILADHEQRIEQAEATLVNHEERITAAEAELADHEIRITQNTTDIAALDTRLDTAETDIASLETRMTAAEAAITVLNYRTTRKKSELTFTGLTLSIPTSATNLVTLLKALTPTSGTFAPFFDTTANKMVVFDENKTVNFKLSIIGTWTGGTTNRSMQLTFSAAVPDTLVVSRNAATTTDNILMATFFSVDQGGFLATNGSTLTIQSNGSIFTATAIKLIAEQ